MDEPELEQALGSERPHPQGLGERQRALIERRRVGASGCPRSRGRRAEQADGPGLGAARLEPREELQRFTAKPLGVLEVASADPKARLGERHQAQAVPRRGPEAQRRRMDLRVLEDRDGLRDTAGLHVRRTEEGGDLRQHRRPAGDPAQVVRALQQPDAIETLRADDPLGPARLRGLRAREELLTVEGGTLSVDEVAAHLHITRQAVNKRRQQGTLVALDAGRHGYRYPAWQFVREGTLRGLELVLAALKKHDVWMQQIFMVSGKETSSSCSVAW